MKTRDLVPCQEAPCSPAVRAVDQGQPQSPDVSLMWPSPMPRWAASPPGDGRGAVGVAADLDDLGAVNGEDLVELLRWRGPGSFGWERHAEPEQDGVTVDFDAVHGGHRSVGEEPAIPVEYLLTVSADAGPADVGVQERREQVQVAVPVRGFEMPGHIGHHAGADRAGHLRTVLGLSLR